MKHALALLAGLAAASPAFAQTAPAAGSPPAPALAAPPARRPAPDQQGERRAQYLAKELGLNPDQQSRLAPILLAQREAVQAMRQQAGAGGQRRGQGQEMKAAQAKYQDQIRAVLTPEQFTKFTQLQAEQRDKMRERRANGQGQSLDD